MSKKIRPTFEWRKRHPKPEPVEAAVGTVSSNPSKSAKSVTCKSK